ncbi:MAG: nuclear transport factor 2 family protein [Steroidobacteraceae bacterium]|jgi:ketosteroid isomerase-like protein
MRFLALYFLVSLAGIESARCADAPFSPDTARAEVAPLLAEMGAAANAHDIDRHVGFYAHDPSVILIVDGEAITGWDAVRAKQAEWWRNGKTDVVYTLKGKPDFRVPAPGLVVTTLFMTSHRTLPSGAVSDGAFAVSSLWQKRPEGWRVIYSHESSTKRRD